MELVRKVTLSSTASLSLGGQVVCGLISRRSGGLVGLEFQGGTYAMAFVSQLLPDGFDKEVTALPAECLQEGGALVSEAPLALEHGQPCRILFEAKGVARIVKLVEASVPEPAESADLVRLVPEVAV